jgi:hypothetical protein
MRAAAKPQSPKAPDIRGWEVITKAFPDKANRTAKQRKLIGDLSRINTRFKVATGLREVQLDGFSGDSMRAYTQLIRVELAYGATEMFALLLHEPGKRELKGTNGKISSDKLGEYYVKSGWLKVDRLKAIRQVQSATKWKDHLIGEVGLNNWLKKEVPKFFNGQDDRFVCLAAAIRHVFTHGYLSADAGGFGAAKSCRVCQLVSEELLGCLENGFQAHSQEFGQLLAKL